MGRASEHCHCPVQVNWWRGCTIGRTLDLQFTGHGFKSRPGTIVYLHLCASVTKQYNLLPAREWLCSVAGKVTVGLASHWACVTDLVVYPPTGL